MSIDTQEQLESRESTFAVFRNGYRVSDSVYPSTFFAQHELAYWRNIIRNWPDGSRLEIRSIRPWNNNR